MTNNKTSSSIKVDPYKGLYLKSLILPQNYTNFDSPYINQIKGNFVSRCYAWTGKKIKSRNLLITFDTTGQETSYIKQTIIGDSTVASSQTGQLNVEIIHKITSKKNFGISPKFYPPMKIYSDTEKGTINECFKRKLLEFSINPILRDVFL